MEITDKAIVIQLMHRFGLSPEKIQRIETIIDGQFDGTPAVVSYDKAAEFLGLVAKNRTKTICLWVRTGRLDAVYGSGNRKAIGVTVDSLKRLASERKNAHVKNYDNEK